MKNITKWLEYIYIYIYISNQQKSEIGGLYI